MYFPGALLVMCVYTKVYKYQSSVNFFSLFSVAFQTVSDIYICFLQWWSVPRLLCAWSFLGLPSIFILLCASPMETKQVSLGTGSWNPSQPDHGSLVGSSPSALVTVSFLGVCQEQWKILRLGTWAVSQVSCLSKNESWWLASTWVTNIRGLSITPFLCFLHCSFFSPLSISGSEADQLPLLFQFSEALLLQENHIYIFFYFIFFASCHW